MKTTTSQLFETFYKGFHSFISVNVHENMIVYTCGANPGGCVDDARRRINELKLPLEAKLTSYNTFTITQKAA